MEETREQKIQQISNLLNTETANVTKSIENWQGYLDTATKFYKYSFTDQILLASQKPNATICAEYDIWRKTFGRTVASGQKGIPLLTESDGKKNIRYVFDISSTKELSYSRKVDIWQFENEDKVLQNLSAKSLDEYVNSRVAALLNNDENKYLKNIINSKENTLLEELDELNIEVEFKDIVWSSVEYIVASRCGIETDLDEDCFRKVGDFNSNEIISQLGQAVSNISETVLREIEKEVRNVEKQLNAERSNNYGQILTGSNGNEIGTGNGGNQGRNNDNRFPTNFGDTRRSGAAEIYGGQQPDISPRPDNVGISSTFGDRQGGRLPDGYVGQEKIGVPENREVGHIHNADDKGTLGTLGTDGQGSQRNGGQADRGNGESRGSNRGTEDERPNGVGSTDEQHQKQSKGDSLQRTDLHLNSSISVDTQAEEKTSPAFSYVNTIPIDIYSEPDEHHRVKVIDTATGKDVFEALKKHLEAEKLIDSKFIDYFSLKYEDKLPSNAIFTVNTEFGGSEGIYTDIAIRNSDRLQRFATLKTLEDDYDAFVRMGRIATECSLMLNGNGTKIRRQHKVTDEVEKAAAPKKEQKGTKPKTDETKTQPTIFDYAKTVEQPVEKNRLIPDENGIIGNTAYKYVPKKTYRKFDKETGLKIAKALDDEKIKFSGKAAENNITLTIDGNNIDKAEEIISNIVSDKVKSEPAEEIQQYHIYQIKSGEEYHNVRFMGLQDLNSLGEKVDKSNYNLVYSGSLKDIEGASLENKLDTIFYKFNQQRPDDFEGHSLSVSDVITVGNENEETAYYVDSFGFSAIPDFFKDKSIDIAKENTAISEEVSGIPKDIVVTALKRGSGFEYGKFRIENFYNTIENKAERAAAIKKEYGVGGVFGLSDNVGELLGYDTDAKGISIEWNSEFGRQKNTLKWNAVEKELGELLKSDNYITPEERQRYDRHNFVEARTKLLKEGDLISVNGDTYTVVDNTPYRALQVIPHNFDSNIHYSNEKPTGEKSYFIDSYVLERNDFQIVDTEKALSDLVLSNMPDDTVSLAERNEYGYTDNSLLPISEERALELFDNDELPVFLLYEDNTEGQADSREDILNHRGMFGVETTEWEKYITMQAAKETNAADNYYAISLTSDAYEESYYISVIDGNTGEEVSPYYDKKDFMPVFETINEAVEYCHNHNIDFENAEEVDSWYTIETEMSKDIDHSHKTITPSEITVGDKFELNGDEYNVTALQGIYPGEVVVSHTEHTGGLVYTTEQNISRNKLADEGTYLGNAQNDIEENTTGVLQNFKITDNHIEKFSPKENFRNNVAAIKTLMAVENESRIATPEEQKILSKYVGWGGLADAFDPRKTNWQSEYIELKELLTPNEYNAARSSTLNAHYTSPMIINAMYKALENLGFKGGKVLEPAMGIGRFLGCLSESLADNTKLYGVELDNLTGRIAKQLYPAANIQIKGFEKTKFKDNSFDVAIGNVPFGNYRVNDKELKSNDLIHDFFFKKSLDKVRPGGVVAFITSKGTLDKKDSSVREYLAERADLLGAIRLPNNAFSEANTEVTSDIIFLQKREQPRNLETDMPDWVNIGVTENGLEVNNYFVNHPEMICGTLTEVSSRFGTEVTCMPSDTELSRLLNSATENIKGEIPEKFMDSLIDEVEEAPETDINPQDYRNFCYTVIDNAVYFRNNDEMEKQSFDKTKTERIKGMVGISEALRDLITSQKEFCSNEELKAKQAVLDNKYNNFTKKFGLLTDKVNKNLFREDDTSALLLSLENVNDKGELISKADIFDKRTIMPYVPITHTDTASEALTVSISEKARVDLDFMSKLCGKEKEEIIKDLEGVIFENPLTAQYETADEYLSGNIRKKLEIAKHWAESNEKYNINVQALTEVIPPDLKPSEISVQLGSSWIPAHYYEQFMYELLDTPYVARSDCSWRNTSKNPFESGSGGNNQTIMVDYDQFSATFGISNKTTDRNNLNVIQTYGTSRMNAYRIIEETLNLKPIKIMDYVEDAEGRKHAVLNEKETLLAQEKQNLIKNKFADWIFNDLERTEDLCRIYNDKFNSTRPREYDGSHITFGGINPEIKLRPHQINAIAHTLYGGNTLLAHSVGAGKTFEMVASAMESKRLGLCTKSMLVVPKHIVNQVAKEFLQLYPTANILVPNEKDFSKDNREKFCSRIATGNYDAIILSHTQLEKIPLSKERQMQFLENEINDTIACIEAAKAVDGGGLTVKQLETTRKNLQTTLEKLNNDDKRDTALTFEELGVDKLYIDEAHLFKNRFFNTKMGRNVSGINAGSASQRAEDLAMKCRYLDELTGSKGVVFATGTPISNSMAELYTMQSYLQHEKLKEQGLNHFDAWASNFGETKISLELAPEGKGYQMKTRFAKFFNLPELMNIFKEMADIKTAESLNLPVPKANFHNIVTEASDFQKEMVDGLAERADKIRKKMVSSEVDNMLNVTNDGRKLALDQRLMNDMLPDYENSKTNECVRNVYEIYKNTEDEKSTQMIFCDLSTPNDDGSFNVYDDIKNKLIAKGIPAEEIAYIHDCKTDEQKQKLFTKVRSGDVRILLGSTSKMGTGTNCQQKLKALHHLDCPWRPSDLEQRNGRIIRQGNTNAEVDIFNYVTKGTFDSYLFQLVENKQRFISQVMTDKSPARSAEDVDETVLSFAQIKALCAGNPMIKEKMDLDIEVSRLNTVYGAYKDNKRTLQKNIAETYPNRIQSLTERISGLEKDIALAESNKTEDFVQMTVDDKVYTDKKDAATAFLESCRQIRSDQKEKPVGSYKGFALSASFDSFSKCFKVNVKNEISHEFELSSDAFGNLTRLENTLKNIPKKLETAKNSLAEVKHNLEIAKAEVDKPFPQLEELREKEERLAYLNKELSMENKEAADNKGEKNAIDKTQNQTNDIAI